MSAAVATQELEIHPAAELFPLMDRAELQELARDIKEQGQLDPVVTWQGKVLDGRNRLAACALAGVEPEIVAIKRMPDPVNYVLSKNLKRRHLTALQRAVVASEAAELMAADATERKREGGREGGKTGGKNRPKAEPPKVAKPKRADKSTARAAKAVGVGVNQVEAVASVKKKAPDVFAAVQAGEVKTVADAKRLANVEDVTQRREALRLVKDGEPAREAIEATSPTRGAPTVDDRLKTIERLMKESRPLAERLQHKLSGVIKNAARVGVNHIGGLGGFSVGVELTALRQTLDELKGMFP